MPCVSSHGELRFFLQIRTSDGLSSSMCDRLHMHTASAELSFADAQLQLLRVLVSYAATKALTTNATASSESIGC